MGCKAQLTAQLYKYFSMMTYKRSNNSDRPSFGVVIRSVHALSLCTSLFISIAVTIC